MEIRALFYRFYVGKTGLNLIIDLFNHFRSGEVEEQKIHSKIPVSYIYIYRLPFFSQRAGGITTQSDLWHLVDKTAIILNNSPQFVEN